MKTRFRIALAVLVLVALAANAFAQPQVSEKKELAIFSLGYYGWNIPLETLGTIDIDIQRVFVDLGRFTIIGMQQRFSTGGLDQFIATIRQSKEQNFVLPERFQFGEAFLTEAEFNRLVGAFIIAVPVVTSFNSQYVNGREWQTDIKTNVSFINVEDGTLLGIANVETSGTSRETQFKSIQDAINGIPMQLQFEIRKIPAFTLNTRVLGVVGGEIKIQLGSNMGIQKGDEYAVITGGRFEGFRDEREVGLLLIKDVGPEVSTAIIRYAGAPVVKDTQLREIPRLGVDLSLYGHLYNFILTNALPEGTSSFLLGARAELTRGFYDLQPYVAAQALFNWDLIYPLSVVAGLQKTVYMRRLEAGFRGGIAFGSNALVAILDEAFNQSDDPWFTHAGVSGGAFVSYLVTRDMKIFVEGQVDYLLGWIFPSYGGYQLGAGVTLKF